MKAELLQKIKEGLATGEPLVLATVVRGPEESLGRHIVLKRNGVHSSDLEDATLTERLRQVAGDFLGVDHKEIVSEAGMEIFLESIMPLPKLIIIGAVHVAIPLTTMAKTLDFRVVLIDPRGAFATDERFPHVDQLVKKWPDEALAEIGIDSSTCVVILTHDPKLDDPAVKFALQHQPAYMGVLGSRRTHEKRMKRLMADGVTEEQLARVHAPVGLEIGALTPAEIALSIMAEIVAERRQGAGGK